MLINRFKLFVLAALLLLADYFFINESIRLITISMSLVVLHYFLLEEPVILRGRRQLTLQPGTRRILSVAMLFMGYIFIVDIYRGQDLYKSLVTLFSALLIVLMLPIFEDRKRDFMMVQWFKRLMLVSIGFALIQFIGFDILLGDIIPGLGPIGVDRIVDVYENVYGRTSGATSYTIAFSTQLSALVLILSVAWMQTRRPLAMIWMIAAGFALVTTQTRAAIIGLVPALGVMQVLLSRHRLRDGIRVVVLLAAVGLGYWLFADVILERMKYLGRTIDTGDTYRFWVNWYMSIGVLKESPWFGIAPQQAWDIYKRYGDLTIYAYNPDITVPIHHNQVGFYLRYYGLIGLGLLSWLYTVISLKILNAESFSIRVVLGSLFLLDFIYSLAHNNKLVANPLLWIMLSLASVDPTKEKESI
jgi:hypothetical protein